MKRRAAIIGAGVGGMAAAARLAKAGFHTTVFEAADKPGGKLNEFRQDGFRFDMGPSLFTLPELVEELFSACGEDVRDRLSYERLSVVCRYFYPDGTRIDAHADAEAFAQEIDEKTADSAEAVRKFLKRSGEVYRLTENVFLRKSLHRLDTYLSKETLRSFLRIGKLDPFRTMGQANARAFADPRTRQLFNRYATYNGSNPYAAPATLNVIAHLEHNLGAYFPKKGMYAIAEALHGLAERMGATFRFGEPAKRIIVENGRAVGLRTEKGEYNADAVVSNMDVTPTYRRLLAGQPAPKRTLSQPPSSSALIFYWGMKGEFPQLDLHNIFFSEDYEGEFKELFEGRSIHSDPTVYVFVSRKAVPTDAPEGCENWFVMVNAPPDEGQKWPELVERTRSNILAKLERRLGAPLSERILTERTLDPSGIWSRTGSHLGALYGASSNNPFAAFLRHPNFSRKIDGLYFCGGSVHPGGGVPLCLLSAQIATDAALRL